MVWNPFVKNKSVIEVEKTISPVSKKKSVVFPSGWFIDGGTGTNNCMTIKRALKFYDDAAPVATAIDWINDEFKTLAIVLKNDKKVEAQSDILEFLKHPNDDMVQEDFLETLGAYYLIANEVYLIASGNVANEPAEVFVVSPEYVSPIMADDGLVGKINVQKAGKGIEVFERDDKSYRFYNSNKTSEIWQIKGFSAVSDGLTSSRGRSKLSSIHREINQYIEAGQHNLSILDNGLLPSGTITTPPEFDLTEEQFEHVREQVVNYYSSAKNAGKVLILPSGLIFTPMGINPKDMDFGALTKQVTMTIFNRYKVPLPLISPDNMTLANMDTAKLNLYDHCVIPLANRMFRELTLFLGPRFKLKPNDLLCADMDSIEALQPRRNEQLKTRKELGVYSINEIREQTGAERIKEGGDIVYINRNLMPSGTDISVISQPIDVTPKKSLYELTTRKQFTAIMQQQLTSAGNRVMTDADIDRIADSEGL